MSPRPGEFPVDIADGTSSPPDSASERPLTLIRVDGSLATRPSIEACLSARQP